MAQQIARDEVAFDEQIGAFVREIAHFIERKAVHFGKGRADEALDLLRLLLGVRIAHEPPGEGEIGKVACQAHARGDGDALKTFADRVHWSSSDSDIALSACCNCCARS